VILVNASIHPWFFKMALDHYVSQVHLKQFYSPLLGELMYATKKSDLTSFRCNSKSVCRIEGNSSNSYLTNDRVIEDFLRGVEPKYDETLAKLRKGNIDPECIGVVSGLAAFVACCAPAAMRMHIAPFENLVAAEAAILDRQGLLPRAPSILGNKTLTELLVEGSARVEVDKKYPQAIGISTIIGRVAFWGNSAWEILCNEDSGDPFFTSDYPIALEAKSARFANWIVPLSPDLAIRIIPDARLSETKPDLSFSQFSCVRRIPSRAELIEINRLMVRSAEDMVFYRDNSAWIPRFIAKNRHYRIEVVTERIPHGTGFLNIATQRVVRHQVTA
jgi:Protein of unknown function (DUF4238)